MLTNLEHLGLAVRDLAAATNLYTRLLGQEPYKTEHVASEAVDTVFFPNRQFQNRAASQHQPRQCHYQISGEED